MAAYRIFLDNEPLYDVGHPAAAVIEPTLELEAGLAGKFTVTLPPDHPRYGDAQERKSMISVRRGQTEVFLGEVRSTDTDMDKNRTLHCAECLSFLADSIQPQAEYHNMTPRGLLTDLIDIHNEQVEERKQFSVGMVTVTDPNNSLYRYTNYDTTLGAIREKLVGTLGGVLRVRNDDGLILDWLTEDDYGVFLNQPIKFGLNLLDYAENVSADSIITALIPRGARLENDGTDTPSALDKRVDIKSVNDGLDYIYNQNAVNRFGWVWGVHTWDDVTVPANLKSKAQAFLSSAWAETLTLTLSAADLSALGSEFEAFSIGDRVRCIAPPYGVDVVLPVQRMTIPLLDPAGCTLVLSSTRQRSYTEAAAAGVSARLRDAFDGNDVRFRSVRQEIQDGVDHLTAMMTGAEGGYKVSEFDSQGRWVRDLYMDAPSAAQATNVIQINRNGIGFSQNGVDGPYTTGITIDGQISADRILTGTMTAALIKAGILQDTAGKNSWNLETGDLSMSGNFESGQRSSGGYWLKMDTQGRMFGGKGNATYGQIDMSASTYMAEDPSTVYHGIQATGELLRISATKIAVAASSDPDDATEICDSGTLRVVTDIHTDSTGAVTSYDWKEIKFVNGLLTVL